jgi:casein kinase II subunit beta
MVEKYERGHFGFCPRVFCHSHPVLPCGRSDLPGLDTVKVRVYPDLSSWAMLMSLHHLQLFCANCIDNYSPPSSRFHGVDGAFFGTTFPHLLFQTYRELAPSPIAPAGTNYSSLNTQSTPQKGANGSTRETSAEASTSDAQASTSSERRASTSAAAASSAGAVQPLTAPTLQQSLLGQRSPQARLYTPRIYGFRVSEQSKSGPRMRWMRMRPESFEELDQGIVSAAGAKPSATAKASNSTNTTGKSATSNSTEKDADGQDNGAITSS